MKTWEKRLFHCGDWVVNLKDIVASHQAPGAHVEAHHGENLPKICTFLNQRQIMLNSSALNKISNRLELMRSTIASEKNANELQNVVYPLCKKTSHLTTSCKSIDTPLPKCVSGNRFLTCIIFSFINYIL